MAFKSYYDQEPMSDNAVVYHDRLIALAEKQKPGIEVSYGDDAYQSILVYPSQQPNGTALLYFHGGGWTNGYKEWMSFMAPALNRLGITFATVGYRLAPQHIFPSAVHDCAAAVNWFAENAKSFGADPSQIFVGGHSAGGHHAAMLAVLGTRAGLVSSKIIRGCAPVSGVYYFGANSGMAVRPRFLGPVEKNNETKASPIEHIDSPVCPFLISYGENDFPHLIRQAESMTARLREANAAVETLILPGCDHFTASYATGDLDGLWALSLKSWMNAIVQEKKQSAN